jgi:CheY-like chemotaxis protein
MRVPGDQLKAIQVLLIDDLASITMPLSYLLQRRGYTMESLNDSRLAMETIRRFRPDVVLLDINMPHVDGYQVAARIRTDPLTQHTPIIAVTSYRDDEHLRRSREAGIYHQLSKPCDVGALSSLIDRIVADSRN